MQKRNIFKNWHTMRIIALLFGLFLAVVAVSDEDKLTGLFSLFFLFQAITNTGCFGKTQCGIPNSPPNYSQSKEFNDIEYDEIN